VGSLVRECRGQNRCEKRKQTRNGTGGTETKVSGGIEIFDIVWKKGEGKRGRSGQERKRMGECILIGYQKQGKSPGEEKKRKEK